MCGLWSSLSRALTTTLVTILAAGCGGGLNDDRPETGARLDASAAAVPPTGTGSANIALAESSATVTQTSETAWTLDKQGSVNTSNSTVTWTVTATGAATVAGRLVVNGFMAVTNTGSGGATIGNIVVNLQTRVANKWVTASSDVANATNGDNATTALVVRAASSEALSTFTENAASGSLHFMDATTNTVFSLVPQQVITPGATVPLLFSATFDNTVLDLPDGASIRAEVIVTFGNADGGNDKNTASNLDINGNGSIAADEARVRSVPARLTLLVPAAQQINGSVVLSDAIDDIATTGTVTVTSSSFSLGSTTGTVTVGYSAGAAGGTITNCAHLGSASTTTSVGAYAFPAAGGVDLDACDTQTVPGTGACTPGTVGCGWVDGSLVTYSQGSWGADVSPGNAAELLLNKYNDVYTSGLVQIGVPGTAGFSIVFTNVDSALAYIPASGPAAALISDLANPTTSSSGVFGGQVLALRINIDFSDANVTGGTSAAAFGDLKLCGLTSQPLLNGISVRDFSAIANTALGGGSTNYSIAVLSPLTDDINRAFQNGDVTLWAQDHLRVGGCSGWTAGSFITYSQDSWGGDTPTATVAAGILSANFDSVYAATGEVEVGIPGTNGFSMSFSSASEMAIYLPASGTPQALSADLSNPDTTISGSFGGEVLGLRINVDFTDRGVLEGSSSVPFGDLTLCGFTTTPDINGLSVRDYLAVLNVLLGGGSTGTFDGSDIATLSPITGDLNRSFAGGSVTQFAQDHLVMGACPVTVMFSN